MFKLIFKKDISNGLNITLCNYFILYRLYPLSSIIGFPISSKNTKLFITIKFKKEFK